MSNIIDKIQISGQSYDVKDSSAATVVELTQQEYDDLPSSAKTGNTLFVITDAQSGDLTNYYTKSETNTLLNGKQATLVSGTNIKTINNTSLLGSGNIDIQGGGGKAVTGGTNISVTTGETADTINCTLNIGNGSGDYSIRTGYATFANKRCSVAEGEQTISSGLCSHAEGYFTQAGGNYSHAEGYQTKAINIYEHASGQYNVSSSASTSFGNSGNTLFSVGNGTSNSSRHNAFEIRQNGDIYLSNGTNDVKLQEYLQIKTVQITQSDYDQLQTKDPNILYCIVN